MFLDRHGPLRANANRKFQRSWTNQLILEGQVHRTEKKRKKKGFLFYRREFLEHSNGTDIRRNLRKFSTGLRNFQIAIINLNPWYNQILFKKSAQKRSTLMGFWEFALCRNWLYQTHLAWSLNVRSFIYSNGMTGTCNNRISGTSKLSDRLVIIKFVSNPSKSPPFFCIRLFQNRDSIITTPLPWTIRCMLT